MPFEHELIDKIVKLHGRNIGRLGGKDFSRIPEHNIPKPVPAPHMPIHSTPITDKYTPIPLADTSNNQGQKEK